MRRRAPLIALIGLAVLLFLHSSARAKTVTARSGDVIATLTYAGNQVQNRNMRLTISRAGHVVYNRLVASSTCAAYCGPTPLGPHQPSLRVLDLDADGPEVVLGLFSGGAHCCFIDRVYSYDAASATYLESERDFGNGGADLRQIGGRWAFVSTNNAFYYRYASFAASRAPIQIFTFQSGRFRDDTRSYPRLVSADAATAWRAFTHDYSQGEGLIAPWAADEYLLGHARQVNSTLQAELRENHLHGGLPGTKFVASLKRFLVAQGY
jgi:hypothetical protein